MVLQNVTADELCSMNSDYSTNILQLNNTNRMRIVFEHNSYSFTIIKHRYFVPCDLPEEGIVGNFEGRLYNGYHIKSLNDMDITQWNIATMTTYLRNHKVNTMEFDDSKAHRKEYDKIVNARKVMNGKNALACRRYRANNTISHRMKIEQTWNKPCKYGCGKIHLSSSTASELKHCCGGGMLLQDHPLPMQPLAPEIVNLLCNDLQYMSQASASINNMLSMCASPVKNNHGGGWENDMRGHHCVKINGRIQHYFPKSNNSTDPSGGLSYFMFDSPEAMLNHATQLNAAGREGRSYGTINNDYINVIKNTLQRTNPYARALRSLGSQIEHNNYTNLKASIHGGMEHFEVANVTSFDSTSQRVCVKVDINTGETNLIQLTSPTLEPITYPLLFNYGEDGWGMYKKQYIKYLPYLRSRILMPDKLDDKTFLMLPSALYPHELIPCSRWQGFARLSQVYMVDMVSRHTDFTLTWIQKNQRLIMHRTVEPTVAADESDNDELQENDAQPPVIVNTDDDDSVYLPSSFHGGRRHLRSCAISALVIMSELGPATGFLTLTCNIDWIEIKSQLLLGQTAFDRPDIVCPVFQKRKAALLHNLKNGVYFPGEVVYIMHVIEFQKRGLPHAHIVFRLSDHPDSNDEAKLLKYCDDMVTAQMPVLPAEDDNSITANINRKYVELVTTKMIHHCAVAPNGCKKTHDSQCKRRYSDTADPIMYTSFKNGYPVYKRPRPEDRRVVPHNKSILIAWDGHANYEFASDFRSILYLFKYLYKGPKPVSNCYLCYYYSDYCFHYYCYCYYYYCYY